MPTADPPTEEFVSGYRHGFEVQVRKRAAFLVTMMEALCGPDSLLALEGDLSRCAADLLAWPGMSRRMTARLQGQSVTTKPGDESDSFVILPLGCDLARTLLPRINTRIGIRRHIWHIQIEQAGTREFSSYDNLVDGIAWCGRALPAAFLAQLVTRGILWRYQAVGGPPADPAS